MSTTFRIALVQMEVQDGQPRANLDRARALIRAAVPADLYLLPELWTTGYAHDCWAHAARLETPAIGEEFARLSVEVGAAIAGSMVSCDEHGRLYNRFSLFAPDGARPITYDKGHLFAPLGEDRHLTPGPSRVRLSLGPWTAALSICFDLRFPEMYRLDALDGADLFLVVAAWPRARCEMLRILARTRAAENQVFLALSNRTGVAADGMPFGGGSVVVAPDGAVVADAGAAEGVTVATIDQRRVGQVRTGFPVLSLRAEGLDW